MAKGEPQAVQQTSTTDNSPWAPQQPHLKNIFGEAERLYNDPSTPQFYPGQTFADPSQSTLQGLAGTEARALAGSPTLAAAQNEATKSLSGDYLMAGNPYFSQMAENVRANVLPGLDSRFMSAGRSGSGMHGRAVGEGLGAAIGGLAYQNYGDERNRMGQYASLAPQLAQADYVDPQMLMAAGQQREQIAQRPIDEAIARHEYENNLPQAKLADYLQMVQGNYGGTTNTTGMQFLPKANPLSSILGGLMGGVGILGGTGAFGPAGWGASLFSDRRLKKDIKRVGETDDGLPIYTYKYKGELIPRMGVMAQEVAEVKPEAVSMMPNGYLGVDYGAL